MDMSQQALQTNGKLFFSNFLFVFKLMAKKQKKYSNELRVMNIDQSAVWYMYINGFVSTSSTN